VFIIDGKPQEILLEFKTIRKQLKRQEEFRNKIKGSKPKESLNKRESNRKIKEFKPKE